MATSNITDQNLARLVTQAGNDALALQQIATSYGLSADDLSKITGIPTKTYNKLFLDAGIPLGTVLTGDVPATAAQKANVKTIGKGDDLVVEKAVGKQGDKILVQQYDAYGNKTSTRLADPNTSEGKGWLQALGIVGLATLGPAAFEALGAAGAGTGAATAGEGILAGTTAADIMAATEALEAAGATTLGSSAGIPAALTATEAAAAGATAGVPAALSSTAPASLTVGASSLPAATSIIPELTAAGAGVLGGAALTSGTTPDVVDEYNVTGGQGTQIPGGGSLGSPATVATTAASASLLKQLADATGLSEDTLKTLLKGGAGLLTGYASYKDAEAAREAAKGKPFKSSSGYQTVTGAGGVTGFKKAASGGVMSLQGGGALRDEMINTRIKQLNPTTGPQGAGADYVNFVKNKAKQDVSKFESDLKTLGLIDPEALETYASNFRYGPTYEEYEESGLDFSPRLNARTDETANVIRALATPSTQARSDYEANISELTSEPTYDIGIPQLYESNMPSAMLSPEYDFSGEMSNKDLATAAMPTGYLTQEDEEELGSGYSGLMALLALKMGEDVTQMRAAGGIASLQPKRKLPPRYLDGHSDGMADKVPANIDGKRPAALSDGEFVIPADVVSHLGNGNSNAGAKRLYKMMDDIRAARTGNPKQGKQINPDKFMPR